MGRYRIRIKQLAYPGQKPLLQDIDKVIEHEGFTIIAGESGCGKTTLLRMLKPQLQPRMELDGEIMWETHEGVNLLSDLDEMAASSWIGYVAQNPASQIVSDQVWHELAFGLENLGLDSESIHQRIVETVSFLGIEDWFHESITSLSGGQVQLLNLASVLVMRPKVILLDEPASQLDPIARQHFFDLLLQIHQEFNIGIILIEHQLEALLPIADRIIYLQAGGVAYDGDARHLSCAMVHSALLPYPARYAQAHMALENEILLKEMKKQHYEVKPVRQENMQGELVLSCEHVYLRYQKDGRDILRDTSIQVKRHEIFCLFGGNGSGKTTLLKAIGSKNRKQYGSIEVGKRLVYLPQDPRILFVKDSLEEEFAVFKEAKRQRVIQQLQLGHLLNQHPYDLSGGEIQRAALAFLLMSVEEEVILMLDEPTKGMDMLNRESFAGYLKQLATEHTILMTTHDIEFAAMCAHRCAFLFDGKLSSCKQTRQFFMDHFFYAPYWYRVTMKQSVPAICYEEIVHES